MSRIVLQKCDCHADVILSMFAEEVLQILIQQAPAFLAVIKVLHLQQSGLDCSGARMYNNMAIICCLPLRLIVLHSTPLMLELEVARGMPAGPHPQQQSLYNVFASLGTDHLCKQIH